MVSAPSASGIKTSSVADQREFVNAQRLQGRTYQSIADELGVSAQWVWRLSTRREPSRDTEKSRARRYKQQLKAEAVAAYGGACACCDIDDLVFLTLDHVDGDGAKWRREMLGSKTASGTATYLWLRKHNYPFGFQVLCFNCNFAKHVAGVCPHQQSATMEAI